MTRSVLAVSAVLIGIMGVTGCMIVDTPVMGVLGSRVRWGEFAQGDDKPGQKQGIACMDTILGLLARGDASVRAAKANGGITEVSVVDHSARNFLNIVGEYCTIVRGT
jgi:TRL-like protein family